MRTLIAFGMGAAAMYLLDPERGRRRRAHGLAAGARHIPEGAQHLGR